MAGDSLSVFSRVRLYTAIYPEGDVADSTERFSWDDVGEGKVLPVLSLRELSLKRLPFVNPLRYQSPIALVLGAKLAINPGTIAQKICQGSMAEMSPELTAPELSWNEAGWITLTWHERALWGALAKICDGVMGRWGDGNALPFWAWQVDDRVRSLREQLRSLHPEFGAAGWNSFALIKKMPDPVQGLLEAIVVFFDRRSEGRSDGLILEYRSLCDAFETMHRQIPLFSVATSVGDRYAVWLVLGWFQQILNLRETTDK